MTVVTDYTALLQETSWAGFELSNRPMFVTYSFPTVSPPSNADPGAMGAAASTFQAFDATDQALARQALQEWADACGLVLLEVTPSASEPTASRGDITFGWYDFSTSPYPTDGGIGFNPGGNWDFLSYPYFTDHQEFTAGGGNIMINLDFAVGGSPGYGLLLHEIGHALGLKHPFELRGAPHDVTLDPLLDTTANTVMSYTGAIPTTLGPLDKQAVAFLYGAAGSDPVAGVDYVWNAATATLRQFGDNTSEILIGVSVLDSITGAGGNDSLFGLDGDDTLNGGTGNDGIFGGSGRDSMIGGTGDDTLDGGTGADNMNGGDGADDLWGGDGNDTLTGGTGDDFASGGNDNDRITGGDGADSLYGDAGADNIDGGTGDDLVVGGTENDVLKGGAGFDYIYGGIGNDKLYGGDDGDQLSGDEDNDQLFGEAGNDNLFGNDGKDTLTGGAGADWLTGGAGNDRFVFGAGFGDDIVLDFQDKVDRLAFTAIPGVTGYGSLSSSISEIAWGPSSVATVITVAGHGTVTLVDIPKASISAADMLFL